MEIKLNLHLQSILNFVNFMENLELESLVLTAVGALLTPFIIVSMWSLVIAVLCQLFWLGVKAGIILFAVSTAYLAFLKFSNLTTSTNGKFWTGPRCTLMDIILSVMFQAGLRIPTVIWDRLVKPKSGETTEGTVEKPQESNEDRFSALWAERQKRKHTLVTSRHSESHSTAITEESSEDDLQLPPLRELEVGGAGDYHHQPQLNTDEDFIKQLLLPPPTSSNFSSTNLNVAAGRSTVGTRRRRGNRTGTRKISRDQ